MWCRSPLLLCLLLLLLSSFLVPCAADATRRTLVVLGVDGLNSRALDDNLDAFHCLRGPRSSVSLQMKSVLESNGPSNWASMFHGTEPVFHGAFGDKPNKFTQTTLQEARVYAREFFVPDNAGKASPFFDAPPDVFAVLHDRGGSAAIFLGDLFAQIISPDTAIQLRSEDHPLRTSAEAANADRAIADRLVELLLSSSALPALTFAHFPGLDTVGHKYGWGGREYHDYVQWLSQQVVCGPVLRALHREHPNTAVLLVSDHGGVKKTHRFHQYAGEYGDLTPLVREMPFLFYDPNSAKTTHAICAPLRVFDVAPIIARYLEIHPVPDVWTGRAPRELFNSTVRSRLPDCPTAEGSLDTANSGVAHLRRDLSLLGSGAFIILFIIA